MKIVIAVIVMCAGCAIISETQNPDTMPQLVYRTTLPLIPVQWAGSQPKLEVLFHVSKAGEVLSVRFVDFRGYEDWESQALEEMKQWRFSPARLGKDSVPVWIRVPINIRFTDVKVFYLAQLVCIDRACADSAYRLLLAGRKFESIVGELPSSGIGTYEKNIGETDLRIYSEVVQQELMKLKVNEFTKPIRFGDSFVIFKRLSMKRVSGV